MEFLNTNKTCRLCLKNCNDSSPVLDEITQSNLNSLLPCLDFTITDEPTICELCAENMEHCLNFKAKCMLNECYITSSVHSRNNLKIKDESNSGNSNLCRFCLEEIECDSYVALENEDAEMLQKHFPELDSLAARQPVICISCRKLLQRHLDFITRCVRIEEKILEYCNVEGTNSKGQVDLNDVANFTPKNLVKNSGESPVIKTEKVCVDVGVDLDASCELKTENVISIKQEENFQAEDDIEIKMESIDYSSPQNDVFSVQHANKCELCPYSTKSKRNLQRHMLSHKSLSEVIAYSCEKCTFKTKYKCYLSVHMMVHKSTDEVTMYKCHLCDYRSKHKSYIVKHVRTHDSYLEASGATKHKCTECSFETKYKENLQRHMIVHKNNSEVTMHRCTECDFETKHERYLQSHVLTHKSSSEVTMHKCTECSFRTKYISSLRKHMIVHKNGSEVTMFRCAMCNFESKHHRNLRKHMTLHKSGPDVTMHRCTECKFETRHRCSLHRHIMMRH